MQTIPLKLLTIIAEAILEDQLVVEIKDLGAKGFTLGRVKGEGSRDLRAMDWEGNNVEIRTIVSPEVADAILTHVAKKYFSHYAVIAYEEEVRVVRGDKYI